MAKSFNLISKHRTLLMGLAMISIIVFHYTEDCVNSGYNVSFLIRNYKTYIGSCGVDIFLLLSGLGLYYSYKKNPDQKSFYKNRFSRILIPYFFVAIPSWFLQDIVVNKTGILQYVKDVLFISFFDDGIKWFWYILMISICYLIYPFLFTYIDSPKSKEKMLQIFVFISVLGIMLDLYNAELFDNINIALLRFPTFFAGCLIGKASYEDKKMHFGTYSILLLSLMLLPLLKSSKILLSRYILGLFGCSLIILAAIFIELLSRKGIQLGIIYKIIAWFGNYSLELYLTHIALRRMLRWINRPTYILQNECILVILSIICSIVLKKLTNYLARR